MLENDPGGPKSPGRPPDFLIIGAAKAGTSSLWRYLGLHPKVYLCDQKEPSYFDGVVSWDRGPDWYRSLFAGAAPDQICGEASTNYARWPRYKDVPSRIAGMVPGVRLIYLVRDPVDRAYSHYIQNHQKLGEQNRRPFESSFEEFFEAEPMLFHTSDYLTQIKQFLAVFPPSSLLVLQFDDLIKQPVATLRRVFRFLGIEDRSEELGRQSLHANKSKTHTDRVIRDVALRPFRRIPAARQLFRALPKGFRERCTGLVLNSFYGRRAGRAFIPNPMKPGTRRALIERFAPSFPELSQITGMDLSAWLDPREPEAAAPLAEAPGVRSNLGVVPSPE